MAKAAVALLLLSIVCAFCGAAAGNQRPGASWQEVSESARSILHISSSRQLLQKEYSPVNAVGENSGQHASSSSGTTADDAAGAKSSSTDADIFSFDLSEDEQAPPVDIQQHGLLHVYSQPTAPSHTSSASTSSTDSYILESAKLSASSHAPYLEPAATSTMNNRLHSYGQNMRLRHGAEFNWQPESGFTEPPPMDVSTREQVPIMTSSTADYNTNNHGSGSGGVLTELNGLDPTEAKEQFSALLTRINGVAGSIAKATAKQEFIPRTEASVLGVDASQVATDAQPDSGSSAVLLSDSTEAQYNQLTQGTSDSASVMLRQSEKAGQVSPPDKIVQESESISSGSVQALAGDAAAEAPLENVLTFDQIQIEAEAVASSNDHSSIQNQTDNGSGNHSSVVIPVTLSPATMTAISDAVAIKKRGFNAGAVTGIVIGAFIAVLTGAGILLAYHARKIRHDNESGYTKTAQNEDIELAEPQKPPAACISPAVSAGGAVPPHAPKASAGGAFSPPMHASLPTSLPPVPAEIQPAEPPRRSSVDRFTPSSSGTGYLSSIRATRQAAAAVSSGQFNRV